MATPGTVARDLNAVATASRASEIPVSPTNDLPQPERAALTPHDAAPEMPTDRRALTEADAIEIWIARWLRIRPKHLAVRYGCHARRLYEIWWSEKFPGSRTKAEKLFRQRYPGIVERTAFGYRRIPAAADAQEKCRQLNLFE